MVAVAVAAAAERVMTSIVRMMVAALLVVRAVVVVAATATVVATKALWRGGSPSSLVPPPPHKRPAPPFTTTTIPVGNSSIAALPPISGAFTCLGRRQSRRASHPRPHSGLPYHRPRRHRPAPPVPPPHISKQLCSNPLSISLPHCRRTQPTTFSPSSSSPPSTSLHPK